jgi:hypothetical protein
MLDEFHKALQELHDMTGQQHTYAVTWLVFYYLLMMVRAIVTGLVVFLLGQRIINAFAFALRDTHKKDD